MEKNIYLLALVVVILIASLQCYINYQLNKRLKYLEEKYATQSIGQAMLAHQFQEYIIEDLTVKSRGRALSDTERQQFQVARDLAHKIELQLKNAGYAIISS